MAIPQLVELGGLVLTAAGAAVPETGQGGTQLCPFDGHGALDGLTELRRKGRGRHEVQIEFPHHHSEPRESEACLSLIGSLHHLCETIVGLMKD